VRKAAAFTWIIDSKNHTNTDYITAEFVDKAQVIIEDHLCASLK
jgi:hypothetical protein